MRFYVNPYDLLAVIARLSASTNTTEQFKGMSSMIIDVIYQINLSTTETFKNYFLQQNVLIS